METVFLACFLFGAFFALISALLGFAGSAIPGLSTGHEHPGSVGSHPGHDLVGQGHPGHAVGQHQAGLHLDDPPSSGPVDRATVLPGKHFPAGPLPFFNLSALLAFLTWFGAAGFLLTHFAGWPLIPALAVAIPAGLVAAALVGWFIGKLLAGERELDPRDYVLEGTIARVSVSIPGSGAGEIVFTQAGRRRGEGARSLSGRPIPRETEVVVIDYQRGLAIVQPWAEFRAVAPPIGELLGSDGAAEQEGDT